jgi:hypothetical protein
MKKNEMVGHVARTGGGKMCICGLWRGNLRKRSYLEDLIIDGRVILKRIFRK